MHLNIFPFHLGPGLRLDRCELGAKKGIIVSDYVSGAEKLLDCARDGRAEHVIASLFNTTLRTWHEASTKENYPLKDYLKKRMPDKIPEHRQSLIEGFEVPRCQPNLTLSLRQCRVGLYRSEQSMAIYMH